MGRPAANVHPYVFVDRAFAFVAVVAALGAALGGVVIQTGHGMVAVLEVACVAVLICSLVGINARETLEEKKRSEIARLFGSVRRGGAGEAPVRREKNPMESLISALQAMAEHTWRASTNRNGMARWGYELTRGLDARRQQTAALAAAMGEDARLIASATSGTQRLERELTEQWQQMRDLTADSSGSSARLASAAERLAESVRAVTSQTGHAASITARLAEAVFATQGSVVAINNAAAATLRIADTLGEGAAPAAPGAHSDAGVAAEPGRTALETMMASVLDLKARTATALGHVQSLADVADAQGEFGHALSHAAMAQADSVRRFLAQMTATQDETTALQTRVGAFSLPESRLGSDVVAQQAVERLPGYADAMAQLLRGLPDFRQAAEAGRAAPQNRAPAGN